MLETHMLTELVVSRLKGHMPPKETGQLSEASNIAEFVVRRLTGHATPMELKHLDEWASLSTENRRWLEYFYDEEWLASRVKIYQMPDREANFEKVLARIDDYRAERLQIKSARIRAFKRFSWVAVSIGIIWLSTHYFEKQQKVSSQITASRNLQENPPHVYQAKEANTLGDEGVSGNSEYKITQVGSTNQSDRQSENYWSLPRAGFMQKRLLPDGSLFWLNSVSSIRFPHFFDVACRNIEVTGEAYFQVKSDNKSRPFQVVVNHIRVKTMDGTFNVNAYEEEGITKITSLKGKVNANGRLIDSGQCALFVGDEPLKVMTEDVNKVSAWTEEKFNFKNDSATFVARELARWYGLMVKYEGRTKTLITYQGSRQNTIENVIAEIMAKNNIELEVKGIDLIIR